MCRYSHAIVCYVIPSSGFLSQCMIYAPHQTSIIRFLPQGLLRKLILDASRKGTSDRILISPLPPSFYLFNIVIYCSLHCIHLPRGQYRATWVSLACCRCSKKRR